MWYSRESWLLSLTVLTICCVPSHGVNNSITAVLCFILFSTHINIFAHMDIHPFHTHIYILFHSQISLPFQPQLWPIASGVSVFMYALITEMERSQRPRKSKQPFGFMPIELQHVANYWVMCEPGLSAERQVSLIFFLPCCIIQHFMLHSPGMFSVDF